MIFSSSIHLPEKSSLSLWKPNVDIHGAVRGCVRRKDLECRAEEGKKTLLSDKRKRRECLGSANPRFQCSVTGRQVERLKQDIWKSFRECLHLVLRMSVTKGGGVSKG